MTYRTPGEIIRAEIRAEKRHQAAVADRAGISPQYMSDIVSGKRIPPPDTLVSIANALEIDAVRLFWAWLAQQVGDSYVRAMLDRPPQSRDTAPAPTSGGAERGG